MQFRIWQDSPEYGCDDNPGYEWYGTASLDDHPIEACNGHIVRTVGPFITREECERALGAPPTK